MKKLFVPIFVLTLLIVLPLISWYYLQRGLTWRRGAMEELEMHGSVKDLVINASKGIPFRFDDRKGSSIIIHRLKCSGSEEIDRITKVVQQFGSRPDVEFIIFGDCIDRLSDSVFKGACLTNKNLCDQLSQEIFNIGHEQNALAFIDGTGEIRIYYKGNDLADWKRLVEHISMMLPDERKQYGKENRRKR